MGISRRGFVRSLTGGAPRPVAAPAWISARGREALVGEFGTADDQAADAQAARGRGRGRGRGQGTPRPEITVRLTSNENPFGPSQVALDAINAAFMYAGRYPMNAVPAIADFAALVARRNGLQPNQVALGSGSGEILNCAIRAFTDTQHGLVTASPSYEEPPRTARGRGVPFVEVPVDAAGRLDLDKMIAASTGAGLVFVCNPNNPTATVHSADRITDAVTRIETASPDTVILIDEAYHDYVTDPAYQSAIPLAASHRNVIVARTMSKAHGMAGMRVGYGVGQPEVVARLTQWLTPFNTSAAGIAASVASLQNDAGITAEQARNEEARRFTIDFFKSENYEATDSQTNFIFVKLGRPAEGFRNACAEQGVGVGRDFPPMEKTHCRISIGTMDEMQKAVEVFKSALKA
jgi:histidinol-phosphate aminotransferase